MTKIDEVRDKANEGCFILRNSDNFIMGESICLGDADNASNYHDEPYTEESYKEFYENLGIDIEKLKRKTRPSRRKR